MSISTVAVVLFAELVLDSIQVTHGVDTTCRRMDEIYANGKELCEKMWGTAFKYESNEDDGYTMWFFDRVNPNDQISRNKGLLGPDQHDVCGLQYYHKDTPGPEGENFRECHPWKSHACCHTATVVTAQTLKESYGPEHHWDRCGPLTPECERFFVQEACFYECDPNAGLFRLHPNSTDPDLSWQMDGMPIKASYCDAWWTACSGPTNQFCGDGRYFACAKEYAQQDAAPTPRGGDEDDSGIDGSLLALLIIGAVLLVCACSTIIFGVWREKSGKPVFTALVEGNGDSTKTSGDDAVTVGRSTEA